MKPAPRLDLAGLSPAWFGMVMATGILSIAAWQHGLSLLAESLFTLNAATYALLWLLNLLGLLRHPAEFADDLADHMTSPGFFTAVAASGVLGCEVLVLAGSVRIALCLWGLAIGLWLLLTYGILAALVVKPAKPALDRGIHGGWLLVVVATQSIAVLSALLAARGVEHRLPLDFLALAMWLCGGMLYIWIATLVLYRCVWFPVAPGDLTPPYWIGMGAMAISTLAGALISLNAADAPFLRPLLPFVNGFTVFCWAAGTWWIPLLLVLAFWRHVRRRFPLRHDPLWWSAVFPLGMYAASTFEMARALDLPFLAPVPVAFLGAALLAWAAAFAGVLRHLLRCLLGRGGTLR